MTGQPGGCGIGTGLLRDAVLRTMQAADIAGIRTILAHAISEPAKRFYERCGLVASPVDPMTVMITVRKRQNPGSLSYHPCSCPKKDTNNATGVLLSALLCAKIH